MIDVNLTTTCDHHELGTNSPTCQPVYEREIDLHQIALIF